MDLGLKGKVALITGASQGIGKAITLTLAEEGCNLAICARREEALNASAEEIRAKGVEVLAIRSDVSKLEDNKNFVSQAVEKLGRIDILVNNAGTGPLNDPMELPEELFRHHMDLMFFAEMVDTTAPTISSVTATPDPQEVYSSVNISALVSDNYNWAACGWRSPILI